MKKTICAILVFVLIFMFMSCGEKQEKMEIDGVDFSASVDGDSAVLSLQSNPTTGYSWIIDDTTNVIEITEGEYISSDTSGEICGAGGTQEFNIKALSAGKAVIPMKYAREWDVETTGTTRYLTVEVEKRGDNLQIIKIEFPETANTEDSAS